MSSRSRLAPVVAVVALALVAPAGAAEPPDDPLLGDQWGLDALHVPEAWATSRGDGVIVAVLDSGVDPDHPDLQGRLVEGRDFVEGDDDPRDEHGHGTHAAGVIAAATGNAMGIAGAAPGARVMPLRVLDETGVGEHDTVAEGIVWAAEHGAQVVNLSLGERGLASQVLKGGPVNLAIRRAAAMGVVVVAAIGNEGTAGRRFRITVPAVVVGAVDDNGAPADFSNFGDPRVVAAPGVGIVSSAPTYPTTLWPDGTDGYEQLDGTSMATSFVSAVAALLVAQGRTAEDVRDALAASASNPTGDPRLGAGLIDAAVAVATPVTATTAAGSGPGAGGESDDSLALPAVGAVLLIGGLVFGLIIRRKRRTHGT